VVESDPSESAQEVEMLLSLLHQRCSVSGPGEIFTNVHSQEFGAADYLHISNIDLFGFSDVQQEVVVSAPVTRLPWC